MNSKKIRALCQDDVFAQNLYAAMCNVKWQHKDEKKDWWGVSWRTAGGIVASLRDRDESYMDFYCSGIGSEETKGYIGEGLVSKRIITALASIGWTKHKEM
jgi:hypothetical protein